MNTLKTKVLLILLNNRHWKSVWQALLIWFLTCATGCSLLFAMYNERQVIEFYIPILVISSPAILIAIPVLYFLPFIQSIPVRVVLALVAILATSGLIISFLGFHFGDYRAVTLNLSPFILSSIIWFFLIARKQIITTQSV